MTEYRVTFGQQYAHEPHPTLPGMHPSGWLAIEASNVEAARVLAFRHLGDKWSFLYGPDEYATNWHMHFPRGELGRIVEVTS